MRQIINGLMYDTDKATLIESDITPTRKRYYYQTKKGTYFCHYANLGKIEIVSADTIKELLAAKDVDKYIDYFGKVEEG